MSKTEDYAALNEVLNKYSTTRMWGELSRECRWLRDRFWLRNESYYTNKLKSKTERYLAWSRKLIEPDDLDSEITLKKLRAFVADCGRHPLCMIFDGNDCEGMRAEEWLERPMTNEEIVDLEAEYELWKKADATRPKTITWRRVTPLNFSANSIVEGTTPEFTPNIQIKDDE